MSKKTEQQQRDYRTNNHTARQNQKAVQHPVRVPSTVVRKTK